MFGRRIKRGLIAAFVVAFGQFTGSVAARPASALESCEPESGWLVCKGDFNVPDLTAFRASIDDAINAADGLTPAKLASWSSSLCDDPAPSRPTEWVIDAIKNHSKQKPNKDKSVPLRLMFKDMRLEGDLMLPDGLDFEIAFENVSMCGKVELRGLFTRSVSFKNVVVTEYSAPGLFSASGAEFEKSVSLKGLVAGSIDLDKVKAADKIELTLARFGHLKLSRAKSPDLLMSSAAQLNDIHERYSTTQPQRNAKEHSLGAVIELTSAKISSLVYADWVRVEGGISAQWLETADLRFQIAKIAHADFRNIRADEVKFGGSTLGRKNAKTLPLCGLGSVLISDPLILSFEDARISGDFLLKTRVLPNGERTKTFAHQRLCLNGMIVGGKLELAGLNAQHLDMAGVRAGHVLQLASLDRGPVVWKDAKTAQLNLSHAYIKRISVSEKLAAPGTLTLTGATIGSIENASDPGAQFQSHNVLATMIASLSDPSARIPGYHILETTLTALGNIDGARDMAFERLRSQTDTLCWTCSVWSFSRKLLAKTSENLGGYGLKPERTMICALVVVIVGALIAGLSATGRALVEVRLERPVGRGRLAFELLLLSFDRLIPLVSLDKLYSEWVFSDFILRSYFVLHALMGLMLAGSVVTFVSRSFGLSD